MTSHNLGTQDKNERARTPTSWQGWGITGASYQHVDSCTSVARGPGSRASSTWPCWDPCGPVAPRDTAETVQGAANSLAGPGTGEHLQQ